MSALPQRTPLAWLVVDSLGRRAVFVDQGRAEQYAVTRRGVVYRLAVMPEAEPAGEV